MTRIVFIHGLNTYGDDDLHVGPLRYGSMNSPWETALRAHGIEVYSPENLGFHPVVEQAELALQRLKMNGWLESGNLFLFGQSSGGLVARALASHNETQGKITGVLTVGTPHLGTAAAELGLELATSSSRVGRALRKIGYDASKRSKVFERYLKKSMDEFNFKFPASENYWSGHALCEASRSQLSWPLLIAYSALHRGVLPGKSDGFVSSESQAWGKCLGRYELDHFGNLGFFLQPLPAARKKAMAEFQRLALDVAITAKSLSRDNPSYASVR
jgi:pimeloyl-ACP methyl ester carboxylesterase